MNTGVLNGLVLNSAPAAGGKQLTYTRDAKLVNQFSKAYTRDAVLRATFSKTYSRDALLQGGSTKFYTRDAVLVTPYHDYGTEVQLVGNDQGRAATPKRIATWSTYSRPANPWDGMAGKNTQTGKEEHYDAKLGGWYDAAGSAL